MSIGSLLNCVKESNIYKLTFNGKVIGLRLKCYNGSTNSFDYYDIDLDTVSTDTNIKNYINSIQKELSCIELKSHNNLLVSDDELNNNVVIKELNNTYQAIDIINKIKEIRNM